VRRREKEGGMNKEFTIEELVELRLHCFYTAQKVERLVMARLSAKHRDKHTEHYSAEEMTAAKNEVTAARTMLRGAVDKMLPALQGLLQETVSV
jgi:hypothetical protein